MALAAGSIEYYDSVTVELSVMRRRLERAWLRARQLQSAVVHVESSIELDSMEDASGMA